MAKYQNKSLNIIAEKYPDIDFSDVDGILPISVGDICDKLNIELMFDKNMNVDSLGKIACENDKFIITVNDKHSFYNNIFTIAHELGHFAEHYDIVRTKGFADRKKTSYTPEELKKETQANNFAAELLMPEYKFVEEFQIQNGNLLQLQKIFGVSLDAIKYRAMNLSLLRIEYGN